MPVTGNELLQEEFEQSLLVLAQQKQSALGPYCSRGSVTSSSKRYSHLAKVAAVQRTGRHAPTSQTPQTLSNRWTVQEMWELGDWIDRFDDARDILANVAGDFVTNFVSALNRVEDSVIISAMGGSAITGQTGTGTSALGAGQKVAVSSHAFDPDGGTGDVALTVYKLQNARKIMGAASGNIDGLIEVALPWNQLMALGSDARFNSWFYNSQRPLETGNQGVFLGFRFHTYEDSLIPVDASSDELVYCWVDRTIRVDSAEQLFTRINEDPDHSYDLQVYASKMIGAVRRDDSLLVEIACDPTPTL